MADLTEQTSSDQLLPTEHPTLQASCDDHPVPTILEQHTPRTSNNQLGPDNQPISPKTFVISGNIAEPKEKTKINTKEVTSLIVSAGDSVYTGDIATALDAEFILITSQKEVDKAHIKPKKTIAKAYRYGWTMVSKRFIIDAERSKECPNLENYKLDLSKLKQTPKDALANVAVVRGNAVANAGKKYSAHQEMKKIIRQKTVRPQTKESTPKSVATKRPCTGYIMFSL
jgi:hypothetical protein